MDSPSADFGFVLAVSHVTFIDELARHMAGHGFNGYTTRHGPVLRVLHEAPLSLTDLASLMQISAPGMHKLVSAMAAQGYLARLPSPTDGRKKLLQASHQGRAALVEARRFHAAFEADLVAALGADDVSSARRVLAHVAARGSHLVPPRLRLAAGGL